MPNLAEGFLEAVELLRPADPRHLAHGSELIAVQIGDPVGVYLRAIEIRVQTRILQLARPTRSNVALAPGRFSPAKHHSGNTENHRKKRNQVPTSDQS